MAESLDVLDTAVSLLIRAVLLAARFSGRVRQRYLRRLASRAVDMNAREIASLVREITKANLNWGRIRVANQLKLLGIFLAASTVRNILQKPKPPNAPTSAATPEKTEERPGARSIPAWYPNHVWSLDTTQVLCWGL